MYLLPVYSVLIKLEFETRSKVLKYLFSEHFLMAASGRTELSVNWLFIWLHGVVLSSSLRLIWFVRPLECILGVSLFLFLTEVDLGPTQRLWCSSLSGVMGSSVLDVLESQIRLCLISFYCRHMIFRMVIILNFVLVITSKDLFFIQNNTKEKCVGSVNNCNARSRHFTDFLHLYKFFNFHFLKYILNCYCLNQKDMFSQNVQNSNSGRFSLLFIHWCRLT